MQYKIVETKGGENIIYKKIMTSFSARGEWARVPGDWRCWEDAEKFIHDKQEMASLNEPVCEEVYYV